MDVLTPEQIKELQDKLAAAEKATEAAKKEAEAAKKVNSELQKTISSQEKASSAPAATATTSLLPSGTVTVEGTKYKIVFPSLNHNGKVYTAHQIAKDAELLKELVAIKSGALVEA